MSNSRRKTKMQGNSTAVSEKEDKRDANRKLRRIVNQKLKTEEEVLPELKEVSNVWGFDKDGKRFNTEITDKELRKYKRWL